MQSDCCREKKHSYYLRRIRDISLDHPIVYTVRIIRVFCPACRRVFALPPSILAQRYQRVTSRGKDAALSFLVTTNGSLTTSSVVARNVTHLHIPRQTLHDWKQSATANIPWKTIVQQLGFSGVLSVDEFRPKRSVPFNLFATDRIKGRILFLDETADQYAISGESATQFFQQLQAFSIVPRAIIADMAGGIHKGARTVFPDALYQYDYFHVVKSIHEKLRSEIRFFWWKLRQEGRADDAALLWDAQWTLLRNWEKWNERDEEHWQIITHRFPGSIIARLPAFKQELRDVFDLSRSTTEAFHRRDQWISNWQSSLTTTKHLKKIVTLMTSSLFPQMITYLDHRWIPRTTNAETLIRTYRKMEKARYGFGSLAGRQNHLKLYQLKTYLSQNVG